MDATMKPMLCKPNGEMPAPEHAAAWVMEPKLDGWRGIIHIREGGVVKTFARSGADHSNTLFHVDQALMDLAPDTVLDGEIIGGDWGDVQGVMTRGVTAPVIVEKLCFAVWDVLRVGGQDCRSHTWEQRREVLERLHDEIDPDFQRVVIVNAYSEPTQEGLDELLNLGLEGVVLKRRDSRYVNGRSPLWTKIKPQETCEAEIIGYKDGEDDGRFAGMVGAFKVRMLDNGVETTVKCGIDNVHHDATQERDHALDPDAFGPPEKKWLGTTIEIKHHGLFPSGKPRHPQFLRRRDDHEGAQPKPKAPTTRRQSMSRNSAPVGASGTMRNYSAMGDAKLLKCIDELAAEEGSAFERALTGSGNPQADLAKAREVAGAKGLL